MNHSTDTSERRYTEKQFCEMYQIARITAHRWRKMGIIRYIRLPTGQVRYLQSHIDELERKYLVSNKKRGEK